MGLRKRSLIIGAICVMTVAGAVAYMSLSDSSKSGKSGGQPLERGDVMRLIQATRLPVTIRRVATSDPDLLDAVIGRATISGVDLDFGFLVLRPGARGLTGAEERRWLSEVPRSWGISGCGNVSMIESSLRKRKGETKKDTELRAEMFGRLKRKVCDEVFGPDASYAL